MSADFEGFDMWDPRYQCDVCHRVTPFEKLHALLDVPPGHHNLETFYGVHANTIGEEVKAGDPDSEWLFGVPPGLGCAHCVTSLGLSATSWDLSDVCTHVAAYAGQATVRVPKDASYEDVAPHMPDLPCGAPIYQWVFGTPSRWVALLPGDSCHEIVACGIFNLKPERAGRG